MTAEYPYEVPSVGAAVAQHRDALGVTFADLVAACGSGTDQILKFVEKADHPSITLMDRHHTALMVAWAGSESGPPVQLAMREQWYTTAADRIMWQLAMVRSPSVQWWWGVKNDRTGRGAWCHLCGEIMHSYDVGRGFTAPARRSVMVHRYEHIDDLPLIGDGSKGEEKR